MARTYEKLDERGKKNIHDSFGTDVQATRTRGEGFFPVLVLPLPKYVTLGNSLGVGVAHHSRTHRVGGPNEMPPENGPEDHLDSGSWFTIRKCGRGAHRQSGAQQGWSLSPQPCASLGHHHSRTHGSQPCFSQEQQEEDPRPVRLEESRPLRRRPTWCHFQMPRKDLPAPLTGLRHDTQR